MTRGLKLILLLILVAGLVMIRAFEVQLFYDPLMEFFKQDHSVAALPEIKLFQLLASTSFRFLLNSGVSLLVLWVLFQKKDVIKVSFLLFLVVWVLLLPLFALLLSSEAEGGHLALFYVRRFLIQPIFLLLLIPAFYFQKK